MATLLPSILTRDAEEAREKLDFLEKIPELTHVQIDFADGKFVPNELFRPRDLGRLETRLSVEAHLMVLRPQDYFHELATAGFKTAFVHFESGQSDQEIEAILKNGKHLDLRLGLAINPHTEIEVFDKFMTHLDEVLVMGVVPGFQGQSFIPETLDRVSALRKKYNDAIIEIDGGLKLSNIKSAVIAGASKVNVGSGIWQTRDPKAAIYELLEEIET